MFFCVVLVAGIVQLIDKVRFSVTGDLAKGFLYSEQ
jgi:hypothetical protein